MESNIKGMAYPQKLFQSLLELVFPYRCLACRQYLESGHLCRKCFNSLPIKGQSECVGCKRSTPDGRTCAFCRPTNPLDRLLIVSDFKDPVVAGVIKRMKYSFVYDLLDPLHGLTRKFLSQRARKGESFLVGHPLLVPVPLYIRRENWRGFNQAAELSRRLATAYQIESLSLLKRLEHRTAQAELESRGERLANVRGLFAVFDSQKIVGRNIMLIDDVCTTGATLNECARVLKDAGASSVSALVLARG
ncbi:MAG TPA: double zinc ribbon domain-containing protein [Candidatus Paceibacterota bacterium]|nr:double zinc ribbon domain-containing protein [Candidatus Paceibacterota bacterium]